MWTQYIRWLALPIVAAVWLESCGAMTFDPPASEEPVIAPPSAPRLKRPDAGRDAERPSE
jgi:hypothetical protein